MPAGTADRLALNGRRIGVLLDRNSTGLSPLRTLGAQLDAALARAGREGDRAAQRTELLQEVGLDPALAGRYPEALAAAERRRALLALALAGKPDLLIADEPAAGLDLLEQRRLLDLILRHCTERGMSLLLASHDLRTVAMLATKVAVLRGGKVVEAGEKQEVFGHPRHAFTRAMLSAGRHRITVRNADFPPLSTTVDVNADQPVTVRHRFGS